MRGLYALKPWYTRRLDRIVQWAVRKDVSPEVFTWLGVISAALAGVAIALGWWLPALVLLAGRLAGANLDGAVARARGVSRPWGFVVNELGDRAGDLLMFAGLAVLLDRTQGPDAVVLVLVATLAASMPTFASLAGAGAGAPRLNGGPFGKTERCLAVVLVVALPVIWAVLLWVIVVMSVVTTGARLARIRAELA
ncbi:CDP-alcohol phosphatidyltransferase family protein [Cellulomonas fengjieae]|uniref:CDP-alcohol phosphatidyltransferase family protein n=1 Tax=Cellulomonas fengjieae TaxID=2819978 RepID=A0ABS3SBR8_9CELL|nr:CDP-alcohol phosphatidyltransferase family protein [Cellulomonas fengjieae]MBO3083087.1 CDP-alcohol phosphatidyltransferase family protein [Cellulomonas fengjieae]QVI65547.1 CDP-alcohol phosphatidyltransferase family protein [Cellulomonas fengjieae]